MALCRFRLKDHSYRRLKRHCNKYHTTMSALIKNLLREKIPDFDKAGHSDYVNELRQRKD